MISNLPQVAHPKLSYTSGSNSTQEKQNEATNFSTAFKSFFLHAAIKYHGDVGEKKQTIEDRNWKVFG